MTSVEPMTRTELLELVSLDAMGLLDEVETALYTRCFHNAPVTVQDDVLRMQAEIASDLAMLPADTKDLDKLELYTSTAAARSAVDKAKQKAKRRRTVARG